MAIYHFSAKMVTRGTGRSACAAAAYMSCSEITNEYDGIHHDYTRKGGLVWKHVFLPPQAPAEWQDREKLWNAVEQGEKNKDSRLAREFVAALPIELDEDEWKRLLTEFIENLFVADGMCADVAIHNTDDHNPHAHILLTVRPLNADGTWQHKTEKEYLCVRDGRDDEERGFTATEFKIAQNEGWEKQYQYKVGKKKVYMTPSRAEKQGLERVSKYPKSSKFGRQNPISERWNSEEQLKLWRETWAETVNRHLEQKGAQERIDHRSHAERGLDEKPTIHEGVAARIMEKKGFISERCELNRQIRDENKIIRALKEMIKKLTEAVMTTIPAISHAMEQARQNMILLFNDLWDVQDSRIRAERAVQEEKNAIRRQQETSSNLVDIQSTVNAKTEELHSLESDREALPFYAVFKRRELTDQIAAISQELEKLKSDEATTAHTLESIHVAKLDYIEQFEAKVRQFNDEEATIENKINAEQQTFTDQQSKVSGDDDQNELLLSRFDIRLKLKEETLKRFRQEHNREMSNDEYKYGAEAADKRLGESKLTMRFNAKYRKMEEDRQQAMWQEKYGKKPKSRRWER